MNTALFTGAPDAKPPAQPVALPPVDRGREDDPAFYRPDPGLRDAVNVALLLGQPLLLTGDPGTGKTKLADRVAWELGLAKPLKFETKSTSTSKDLFYTFDALRRFHAAHTAEASTDNRDYLTYNALGLAILCTHEPEAIEPLLPRKLKHPGRCRSVVLVDEVDKAPRDFPNDLLNEIEPQRYFFRIPELGNAEVHADPDHLPVIIITSNSEKNLPDPFLRRCVYYHIPPPDKARLADIVRARLAAFDGVSSSLPEEGAEVVVRLRECNLRKPPSGAELINWLNVLLRLGASPAARLRDCQQFVLASLSALVKAQEDVSEVRRVVGDFLLAR